MTLEQQILRWISAQTDPVSDQDIQRMRDQLYASNSKTDIVLFNEHCADVFDDLIASGLVQRIPNRFDKGFTYRLGD
jgi:hypothetical protein